MFCLRLAAAASPQMGKLTWQRSARYQAGALGGVLGENVHDCCGRPTRACTDWRLRWSGIQKTIHDLAHKGDSEVREGKQGKNKESKDRKASAGSPKRSSKHNEDRGHVATEGSRKDKSGKSRKKSASVQRTGARCDSSEDSAHDKKRSDKGRIRDASSRKRSPARDSKEGSDKKHKKSHKPDSEWERARATIIAAKVSKRSRSESLDSGSEESRKRDRKNARASLKLLSFTSVYVVRCVV